MPKRGLLEQSLALLVALNTARLRRDHTQADALQAELAFHDAKCGYYPKHDRTPPYKQGDRTRHGGYGAKMRSDAWWVAYNKRQQQAEALKK